MRCNINFVNLFSEKLLGTFFNVLFFTDNGGRSY